MKKNIAFISLLSSGMLFISSFCNACQASAAQQNTTVSKSSTSNDETALQMLSLKKQAAFHSSYSQALQLFDMPITKEKQGTASAHILKLKPSAHEKAKEENQEKEKVEKNVTVVDTKEAYADQPSLFDSGFALGQVLNIHFANVKDKNSIAMVKSMLAIGKDLSKNTAILDQEIKQDKEDKVGLEAYKNGFLEESIDAELLKNKEFLQQQKEKIDMLQNSYPAATQKWCNIGKKLDMPKIIHNLLTAEQQFEAEASAAAKDALKKTLIQLKVTNVEQLLKQFEPIK